MPQEVIDRVNAIGINQDQPKLLTFYDRKGELVGDLVEPPIEPEEVSDLEPDIPSALNAERNDTLPDELLEPLELLDAPQLANLHDELPQELPAMSPIDLEPLLDPAIVEEGVDNDVGLRHSTRTRAQPSSYIPSLT